VIKKKVVLLSTDLLCSINSTKHFHETINKKKKTNFNTRTYNLYKAKETRRKK